MDKKRVTQIVALSIGAVVVILFIVVYIVFGTGSKLVQLPSDTWVRLDHAQPSIYVRCVGLMSGRVVSLGFLSAEEPPENMKTGWESTVKKYSFGSGEIGETVVLGQRTVMYDAFGNPSAMSTDEYVRFEVVNYDKDKDTTVIRVLPPKER